MADIRKFTLDEIRTINFSRKEACILDSGDCYIVSRYTIFDDCGRIEVTEKFDVNVFATSAEAYKWAALMTAKRDDSWSVKKYVYSVRYCRVI